MRLENAKNLRINIPEEHKEAKERRETFVFDTAQEYNYIVSWLMFVSATSP